jgi:hypothetical protein
LFPADLFDNQLAQVFFDFTDVSAFQAPLLDLLNTLAAKACWVLIQLPALSSVYKAFAIGEVKITYWAIIFCKWPALLGRILWLSVFV